MVQLQAHRGVCTEYPENTMAAYYGAVCQGYDIIELDPNVTADGEFIILHDSTIKRTARRPDGSKTEETRKATEMTYAELDAYDYGLWFSPKFKGERIPLLKDVFPLVREHGVLIKIDNKIWKFPEEHLNNFWKLLRESGARIGITCDTMERVKTAVREVPNAEIHYDGVITEEALQELCKECENPVVWVPYECKDTSWVKIPFASKELCDLVKRYARLGVWLISNYEDFDAVCAAYEPDMVETPGQIKPVRNAGRRVDGHTHSEYSHDSKCSIREMAVEEAKMGTYGFAVTDHCGMRVCKRKDVAAKILASVEKVNAIREELKPQIHVYSGIEIGEAIWYPEESEAILNACDYDVVVSSVHTVKLGESEEPYSRLDFSTMEEETIDQLLTQYLEDMLTMVQTIPCDVAAHLLCPLHYINGNYGRAIDCKRYEEKIRELLQAMIRRGIALEINTSGMYGEDGDWLEQDWLLGIYKELGGCLITLASDAHVSERASDRFDQVIAMLKKHGFRNCFYYEKRNSIQCAI